jgi:hypothetical protein
LAGLVLIAGFTVPVPWYGPVGAAISSCVPGAVLLALDRFIGLLTEIRNLLCIADRTSGKKADEEFVLSEDQKHDLGAAAGFLRKGRVEPDDITAQFCNGSDR